MRYSAGILFEQIMEWRNWRLIIQKANSVNALFSESRGQERTIIFKEGLQTGDLQARSAPPSPASRRLWLATREAYIHKFQNYFLINCQDFKNRRFFIKFQNANLHLKNLVAMGQEFLQSNGAWELKRSCYLPRQCFPVPEAPISHSPLLQPAMERRRGFKEGILGRKNPEIKKKKQIERGNIGKNLGNMMWLSVSRICVMFM